MIPEQYLPSFFMQVILVVGSLVSVIIYRIIARVDWFKNPYQTLKSNLTSSILNSASIMLLGFFYKYLANKLTDWGETANIMLNYIWLFSLDFFKILHDPLKLRYLTFCYVFLSL